MSEERECLVVLKDGNREETGVTEEKTLPEDVLEDGEEKVITVSRRSIFQLVLNLIKQLEMPVTKRNTFVPVPVDGEVVDTCASRLPL